jgi:hypothetical protein
MRVTAVRSDQYILEVTFPPPQHSQAIDMRSMTVEVYIVMTLFRLNRVWMEVQLEGGSHEISWCPHQFLVRSFTLTYLKTSTDLCIS